MGRSKEDALLRLLTILICCTSALCQNVPNCTTGTIYPNEFDQTQFYVCYDGKLRNQKCPLGMRFDPTQGFCTTGSVDGGKSCGDIPNGGFTPSTNDPTLYYICTNGKLVLQKCPSGQTFNPMLRYCTSSQILPPVPPRPPPPPPPPLPNLNCNSFPQGSFVADIVDETKYYVCVLGELRPQVCPAGYVFDKQLLSCVQGATTPQPGSCGPYQSGDQLPLCDGDSQYFLVCTLGVFLLQKCTATISEKICPKTSTISPSTIAVTPCPSNTIFDSKLLICINPFGAVTGQYAANPNDPTSYFVSPSLTPVKCPAGQQFFQALDTNTPPCTTVPLPTGPPGASYAVVPLMLNPMNPPSPVPGYTQYYILYNNGAPMVQRCPEGFIVYQGQCMKLTRTSSRALMLTSDKPCNIEDQGKYLPVENDCQKFQVCFNSQFIEHICPDGQYFDATLSVCSANRGQCQSTHIDKTSSRSKRSLKHSRNADNAECFGKHGVFTADPYDCRRFYACINGWKIGQSCQEGEAFDPKTQSCTLDYEEICPTYSAVNVFLENLEQTSMNTEVSNEQIRADVNCAGRELGEFLANPEDCTSYYVCSNGFAIPKQCPAEHYFDTVKHICRPSDGSCEESHESVESTELPIYLAPSDNTSICTGKHGIIVPDPEDCTSFFLCIYGRAHHDRCYEGEYFDSQQRHCTLNNGLCSFAIKKEQSNEASEVVEEIHLTNACNGYFDGTHLPNPDNCHQFFVCIDGIPIPEQCGENEFFDSIHGFCRQNQDGADSCSNMISEKSVCYGKHGIHVEHQEDCRKYYLCVNGQALVHDCNVNEYFNTRMGACILDIDRKCPGNQVVPEKVDELVKENISWNTVETESKPVSSSVENSNEMYQYNEYEHFIGKPIYQKPALHVYKPETPKRKLPKCTKGMNEYMFYPNVEDNCRTFYECINGKPIQHSCPVGFVYNAVLNICDVPDFVECTHTMNIRDTRDPSCEGAISGVRYANFENGCKSFYVCSHGNAIHTYCGEGLRYNPIMGVCDWEANVQCSNGRERKRS